MERPEVIMMHPDTLPMTATVRAWAGQDSLVVLDAMMEAGSMVVMSKRELAELLVPGIDADEGGG